MKVNMSFIQAADVIIKINEIVRNQNIELCEINHKNNLNDTDKKYINPDLFNLLNILIVLMEIYSKLKLNLKTKNAKIVQEHVKKKKQYAISRILYQGKYIDASQQANPAD